MEPVQTIDGTQLVTLIQAGCQRLHEQVQTVNDLNVFPIPDGDTGSNMLMTVLGGVKAAGSGTPAVGETARRLADGMLLSARGNSGVILSQIFDGIAVGLDSRESAGVPELLAALGEGVRHAYGAVLEPTEGTVLTVLRQATERTAAAAPNSPAQLLEIFVKEAAQTLSQTPDMLPVLKKAGVVDSGGAGLVYLAEGALDALNGHAAPLAVDTAPAAADEPDIDRFTADSVLEYGYCTELLIRLQRCKTDPDTFATEQLTDYLKGIGDSVVAFKTGSLVKLHIHTATPDRVLAFCQRYGEFLKIKIENMSLQHNNTVTPPLRERRRYGVVAVATGAGLKELFSQRGADVIVEGGQTLNPSAEEFLAAFAEVNADTVFVLPNNPNILLTAKQAAALYTDSEVRVIESCTVGDGYAALSMLSLESDDPAQIAAELTDAMNGVVTAAVSQSVRDTADTRAGEYIGFVDKEILSAAPTRGEAADALLNRLSEQPFEVCIFIYGQAVSDEEAAQTEQLAAQKLPGREIYRFNGGQAVYDYLFILE